MLKASSLMVRQASVKTRGDWVTEVDHQSEETIVEVLRRRTPGVPVLAEESGGSVGAAYWLVDPLDGTTNFAHGLPLVAISIALVEGDTPALGVILAPWLGLEFAFDGRRLTCNGDMVPRVRSTPLEEAILATGFPFRHRERLARYLPVMEGALTRFEDLRRLGSAALDLAWTATGRLQGYFELSLGPWDVAAGAAMVLGAGGRVTDWEGGPGWLRSGDVLAAPPAVHEALLELARQASQG